MSTKRSAVRPARRLAAALLTFVFAAAPFGQASALLWNWSYSGTGITAAGTFTTDDTPDGGGHYLITAITGSRNGVAITGLMPAGTPIPGNEPFAIDNLVALGSEQLTGDGFGYQLADGNYVSPFFASFLSPPGYLEVYSAAPFVAGFNNFGPEDSELPITFSAVPVPEPATLLLLAAGIGALGGARRWQCRRSLPCAGGSRGTQPAWLRRRQAPGSASQACLT